MNSSIREERYTNNKTNSMPLSLFKIQFRNTLLVLHTLPVVAYWIIYSENANFVLDRKKIHYVQGMRISFTLGN